MLLSFGDLWKWFSKACLSVHEQFYSSAEDLGQTQVRLSRQWQRDRESLTSSSAGRIACLIPALVFVAHIQLLRLNINHNSIPNEMELWFIINAKKIFVIEKVI